MRLRVIFQKRTPNGGRRQLVAREFDDVPSFIEGVEWALKSLRATSPALLPEVVGLKVQAVAPPTMAAAGDSLRT